VCGTPGRLREPGGWYRASIGLRFSARLGGVNAFGISDIEHVDAMIFTNALLHVKELTCI
jgi:hypothetical protein